VSRTLRIAGIGALSIAGITATWLRVRSGWGSTRFEQSKALAGDDVIPAPRIQTTHAVTLDAHPGDVWQWLVQMGYHRAGWYTPEWVDQLWSVQNPSSEAVVADLQTLRVGDRIPDGPPGTAFFDVVELDPYRVMVLHSMRHPISGIPPDLSNDRPGPYLDFSWSFVLEMAGVNRTRLLMRTRSNVYPVGMTRIAHILLVPIDVLMSRWMLLGVKRRAETVLIH
jgi:hypothetical protein